MEAATADSAQAHQESPLITLEIKVIRDSILATARGQDDSGQTVAAELVVSERTQASIDLLADLLRDAMDLEDRDNNLHDDLYRRLLRVLGQELFDLLFRGEVGSLVSHHLQEVRLRHSRVRLNLSFMEGRYQDWLSSLPWEYLHTPNEASLRKGGEFLASQAELMLSRRVEVSSRTLGDDPPPVKVLLVCASPTAPGSSEPGLRKVDPGTMLAVLKELENAEFIELETLIDEDPPASDQAPEDYQWAVTREAFVQKVADFDPVLIHFIGHGRRHHHQGQLALSYSNGKTNWIPDRDFATDACQSDALRTVVLQACESALPDPYVGFSGVAQQLAGEGIPAVVAMQYRIAAPTADAFARAFYGALARDDPVDVAVKAGRVALKAQPAVWEQMSFGLPVLYLSAYRSIAKRGRGQSLRVGLLTSQSGGATKKWQGACAVCGHDFDSGAAYCSKCGKKISPHCPSCGRFYGQEPGNFCSGCGEQVGVAPPREDVAVDLDVQVGVAREVADAFEGPGIVE